MFTFVLLSVIKDSLNDIENRNDYENRKEKMALIQKKENTCNFCGIAYFVYYKCL